MRYNGFKRENFLVQQKRRVLGFSSPEVRFLVDSSNCSNNKSLTRHIVMMIPYFFDETPPSNSSCISTRHTNANMMVTGLALGLFVLYNTFLWLTTKLRGCTYYCQHLTVAAIWLLRTLSRQYKIQIQIVHLQAWNAWP